MKKIIFDTEDILNEFLTRAYMKGLTGEAIDRMIPIIIQDGFKLVRTIKIMGTRKIIHMVEWNECGVQDSDEWNRPSERFASAFAENYICDASKLPY